MKLRLEIEADDASELAPLLLALVDPEHVAELIVAGVEGACAPRGPAMTGATHGERRDVDAGGVTWGVCGRSAALLPNAPAVQHGSVLREAHAGAPEGGR